MKEIGEILEEYILPIVYLCIIGFVLWHTWKYVFCFILTVGGIWLFHELFFKRVIKRLVRWRRISRSIQCPQCQVTGQSVIKARISNATPNSDMDPIRNDRRWCRCRNCGTEFFWNLVQYQFGSGLDSMTVKILEKCERIGMPGFFWSRESPWESGWGE